MQHEFFAFYTKSHIIHDSSESFLRLKKNFLCKISTFEQLRFCSLYLTVVVFVFHYLLFDCCRNCVLHLHKICIIKLPSTQDKRPLLQAPPSLWSVSGTPQKSVGLSGAALAHVGSEEQRVPEQGEPAPAQQLLEQRPLILSLRLQRLRPQQGQVPPPTGELQVRPHLPSSSSPPLQTPPNDLAIVQGEG